MRVRARANWLVLQLLFYSSFDSGGRHQTPPGLAPLLVQLLPLRLLLFQINRLVVVPGDPCANRGRCLALLCQAIGVERFLGAGGAFRPVQPLIATAQAGVAKSAVATAVAGKL